MKIDRVKEWIGLEAIFSFQPPCHEQGHLALDQVAQSPTQFGSEHFQGWDTHKFSGQSVPEPYHNHSKKFLPNI